MAAVQAENIADMVITTLNSFGEGRFTDLSYSLQEHVALPNIIRKKKIQFEDGLQHEFQVMVADSGAAENVALYQELTVGVPDVMKKGTVPIRHTNTKWAYDDREVKMNSGQAQVNNIVKVRRHASLVALTKQMETDFWSKPASSADEVTPWGIRMSIVYAASTTVALTGGNPSGFTGGYAGLSSSTYDQWRNWTSTYTNMDQSDGIAKMRESMVKSNFMAPVKHPDYQRGPSAKGIYCNYDSIKALEDAARQQNDQLGFDVASTDGQTTFRRVPLTYTPQLDSDTQDPVMGIDWSYIYPVFLSGFWMKEHPPIAWDKNPNVHWCHLDLSWNIINHDRRRMWITAKAAS